ncbi:NACHT domain-containing NTPase [Micromonospora sp. RP3T]|uniref:NACHT domain-containing protein n=1 Tax=Micromonospora sp. RP3T TaxID=2135446 RepID=UPI000D166B21|nr:hypothetical protein [Micromonospora sp. RP3T]PTA46552.1 hypothetical protein C8054_09225 [Micromonospora sp. RP3T]
MIRHYGPTGVFLGPVTMHGRAVAGTAAPLSPERLAGYYRRTLDRPVLDPEDIQGRAVAPTLRALFVPATCRVIEQARFSEVRLALDTTWVGEPVVDLLGYVRTHLRGENAPDRPLVVVGHPGSGKSTFARFCVAELAAEGALVILVELRAVVATAPVQEQIEQALYQQTGIRTSWPDAAGAHAGTQVVVVLDGLDELVNAGGVVQARYVESVREFQRRERDNGRPTAVVITSRINALTRAELPPRTTVARLEPFDDRQVEHWLTVWNHSNEPHLRSRGLRTLRVATVLRYPDLARYPLLLMMLALYDAADNALQRDDTELDLTELYERVLTDFVTREVAKRSPALRGDDRAAAIRTELRKLGIVATGMHIRGRQIITEAELDGDMAALMPAAPPAAGGQSAGQEVIGRFFFVHSSRALLASGRTSATYEFLHATFGEFFVAHIVRTALVDRETDLLRVVTSSGLLFRSGPITGFLRAALRRTDPAVLGELRRELSAQLRGAFAIPPTDAPDPVRRLAHHSANLAFLLVLTAAGSPVDVAAAIGLDTWQRLAGLWRTQLPQADWSALVDTIQVTRKLEYEYLGGGYYSDHVTETWLHAADDEPVSLDAALPWESEYSTDTGPARDFPFFRHLAFPARSEAGRALREAAILLESNGARRNQLYSLSAMWASLGALTALDDDLAIGTTLAGLLWRILFDSDVESADERIFMYEAALGAAKYSPGGDRVTDVLLRRLELETADLGPEAVRSMVSSVVPDAAVRWGAE